MACTATQTAISTYDRQRLMRSAKKLEAVLGTTPQCEFDLGHRWPRRSSIPSQFVMDISPAPRSSSLRVRQPKVSMTLKSPPAMSKQDKPKRSATPLVLRLQPRRSRGASVSSVISEAPGPNSPLSPTFECNEEQIRRKRVAKLCRTLGENISPELVFGKDTKRDRRRSGSVGTLVTAVSAHHAASLCEYNDVEFSSSQDTLIESSVYVSGVKRSPSLFTIQRRQHLQHELPFSKTSLDSAPRPREPTLAAGRRKERDWSGEWNTTNLEDVKAALRNLK